MSRTDSPARQARDCTISYQECRAIRALDGDSDYSRSEIAFMFECKVATAAQHADRECSHVNPHAKEPAKYRSYTDAQLRDIYLEVFARHPHETMGAERYNRYRDGTHPTAKTLKKRFGSWPEARQFARGGGDE